MKNQERLNSINSHDEEAPKEIVKREELERRTDGVVALELGRSLIPTITLMMTMVVTLGIAVDTVVAALALRPGHGANVKGLEYDSNLTWNKSIAWQPIVAVEVRFNTSYTVPDVLDLQYEVTWHAKGGIRSFQENLHADCNVTANDCDSVIIPKPRTRRGVQTPYGGPVIVTFKIINGTQEVLNEPEALVVNSITITPIFINVITYTSGLSMILLIPYIVRFYYMLSHNAEPNTPDQYIAAVLLMLFLLQIQSVLAARFLGKVPSSVDSHALRIYLTICPYVFAHALQASVLGLTSYYKPKSAVPYVKMGLWFTVMTGLSTVYAFRAVRYEEDISASAWDAQTLNGHFSWMPMSYTCLKWIYAFSMMRHVWTSHKHFLHVPYLVFRNKYLKMCFLNVIIISLFVHEFGTIASHIISVSPIQGTSLGTCCNYAVVTLCFAGCLIPIYQKGDDTLPPPPSSDVWKTLTWSVEWKKWIHGNSLSSLYFFTDSSEEKDFWVKQNKGESEEICESPSLCSRRSSGVTLRACILTLLYGVQVFLTFFFILSAWLVAIFFIIIPPLKSVRHAAVFQRTTTSWVIEKLYAIPPRSRVIGMYPLKTEKDSVASYLCDRFTWLTLLYMMINVFLSYVIMFVSGMLGLWGVILSMNVITASVGTLLMTCHHVASGFLLRLSRGIAVCMLIERSEIEEKVHDKLQEYTVTPFCLETCITMSHIAYETYRECPGVTEEILQDQDVDQKKSIVAGWLPKSGLASANVLGPTGTKRKDRRIDLARYGLDLRYVCVINGLQFIIGVWSSNNAIFVGFRGTSNAKNKMTDLNVRRKPWEPMTSDSKASVDTSFLSCWGSTPLVHRGFAALWESVAEIVHGKIAQLLEEGYERIFITGHSLGAAVATLSAYSLAKTHGTSSVGLITFGTPLMGNQAFADFMMFRVPYNMNLRNENDACTRAAGTFANVQTGNTILVGRCGQLLMNPAKIERIFAPWGGTGNPFAAHKLVRYQSALSITAALFHSNVIVFIGEEVKGTDRLAWVTGPSLSNLPVGAEVGYPQNGVLVSGRVMGFPKKKVARIRLPLTPPFDTPVTCLLKPPLAVESPLRLHVFPERLQVVVGPTSKNVTYINPSASPSAPPLPVTYGNTYFNILPPPPLSQQSETAPNYRTI